jgi:protein TonB
MTDQIRIPRGALAPQPGTWRERWATFGASLAAHAVVLALVVSMSGAPPPLPVADPDLPSTYIGNYPEDMVVLSLFPGAPGPAGPEEEAPAEEPAPPPPPPPEPEPVEDVEEVATVIDLEARTRRPPSYQPDVRSDVLVMGTGGSGTGASAGTGSRGGGGGSGSGGGGGSGIRAPVPRSVLLPPTATPKARGGRATLRLHVDHRGRVEEADVIVSSGDSDYDRLLRMTALDWQFRPALDPANRPVAALFEISFQF